VKPRVLVIDNFDSFTYNIVQALGALGARVEVARADSIAVNGAEAVMPSGIVISPGPGRPEDAGASMTIARCFSGRVPVLGVCLGHQAVACAFGASVGPAPLLMHGKCSSITHSGSRLFDRVPSPLRATRYHSLVVIESSLRGTPLRVLARADDHSVMAIGHETHPTYGLQFHPESVMSEHGLHIFSNFLELCSRAAA